ncbi:MAG: histidine kinase, partial [Acidobacteria bacterium]|nr:histidine kinase [Acidobacteriota bacterium]
MQVAQVHKDYPSKMAIMETALSASQELNRAILTSLDDHLAILDESGQIIAVNEAWTRYGNESCNACRLQHQCQVFRRRQYFNTSSLETRAALDGIQSVIDGSQESFEMEYPCPTDSGHRWFRMSVTPLGNGGVGAILSHHEVTERKQAEEKLQELTGQLINAQEEERRRIARELHDDLNQRLALLIIDLEQLGDKFPEKQGDLRKQLQDLGARAREISTDVHRMSYRLHPSKLETLGLVAAVRGLCHEVSERHGLKIVFSHRDVPGSISKDVALCLFRVAQESLHNTVKHSGAK